MEYQDFEFEPQTADAVAPARTTEDDSSRPTIKRKRQQEYTVWQTHPSWKGMLSWYTKWGLGAFVIDLIVIFMAEGGVISIIWPILIILLTTGVVVGIGRLIRQATLYRLTNRRIFEVQGILNKTTDDAYFEHITNARVDQNLMERILGIGRIDFDTPMASLATQENRFVWWGVPNPHQVAALVDEHRGGHVEERGDD